jgi:hypothetical protein
MSPCLLLTVAEFELFLGLWLWSGFYPNWSWRAALGTFCCFFAVALYQALAGERSCACFGPLSVAPWIMVVLDAAIVLLLAITELPADPSPPTPLPQGERGETSQPTAKTHQRRFAIFATVWLTVGASVLAVFLLRLASTELLVVSTPTLDLGTVEQSTYHDASFTVRNPDSVPVTVAHIQSTCPCMTFRIDAPTVPAGGESPIVVRLDLNREPDYTGRLAIDVQGLTNDNQVAFRMTITVRVATTVPTP